MANLVAFRALLPLLLRLAFALLRAPSTGLQGAERAQAALNAVFARAERLGLFPMLAAFDDEFPDYPELRALEAAFPAIEAECLAVLQARHRLPGVCELAGDYTDTQLNRIGWKALMLTSNAKPIADNCVLCPQTGALLARLPGVFNAFFSVLEPGQYIQPHFGYYKGLLRFHLGVVIPDDNADRSCWIRVNADPLDNASRDRASIARGQKHYWRNGRGFMFDDTHLHDAHNGSNRVRVVLFVDVIRKLPPPLARFNRLCLWAAYRLQPALRDMHRTARVRAAG